MLDSIRRWLPYPVYRFVGGPFDGKSLAVRLIETERGMMAPEVWNLLEPLVPLAPTWKAEPISADKVRHHHSYRFVGGFNEGHYEYIEP